ncbi:peptidoglycan-binding protein [Planococcus liqunii]|uniref:peptidoglycan-binding domain-containing protein n=1 Tax=Planococcus liqunii TaxID=3058394 RepID=UPI00261DE53F|nr:peptidoglycan-binding protein [Planococcus sp. N056]WKA51721.1 peptidoglycan-binding protein [Planococcus sp. N056]
MKKKCIPMLLVFGLLAAFPLSFQPAEAASHSAAVKEDKLPANLEKLMTVAPEHQYTLRKGSTRVEVKLLQWTLNQYGLKTAVDGVFGAATDRNVRQYQKDKGLKADGIVGIDTWVAIYAEHKKPTDPNGELPTELRNLMDIAPEHQFILREGSNRMEVLLLQWTLNQYGLKTAVDGVFGAETNRNVRQYQADKGLKVDGVVGVNTWVAIYGEYQ